MRNQQATILKSSSFLDQEEVQALIQAIHHPVVHYAVMTMAYSGLRVSEVINLKLQNVDFSTRQIHVINGKGGKDRVVPMHHYLSDELMIYLKKHRPEVESSYFFATIRSGTLSNQYVNRVLRRAAKEVGIEKHVSSHDLRRAFASLLSDRNVNVKTIQMLLGHENLKTTSFYIFTKEESMQEAIASIDF